MGIPPACGGEGASGQFPLAGLVGEAVAVVVSRGRIRQKGS